MKKAVPILSFVVVVLDLGAVVRHYDSHFKLRLTPQESRDLVEYLKSL